MSEEPIKEHEKPKFDVGEWRACTRHGMVWKIFPDDRNQNPDLYEEALLAVKTIIKTGQPIFGSWH